MLILTDVRHLFADQHSVGGNDTLVAIGSFNTLFGDFASFMQGKATGGNDILTVDGDFNTLYGDTFNMFENTQGGNDILTVTGNNNTLVGDASDMYGNTKGGNDTLTATGNNNTLYGDAIVLHDSAQGGADTFVFGSANGTATIMDFRTSDGDKIKLTDHALTWAVLDSNSNNVLDDGDAYVAVVGTDTVIDLGAAATAGVAPNINLVTVVGVSNLVESDFIFA